MKKKLLLVIIVIIGTSVLTYGEAPSIDRYIGTKTPQQNLDEEQGWIRKAPEEYRNILRSAQYKYQLPEELVYCLATIESNWDEKAISHANCQGLTQINVKHLDWLVEKFWSYNTEFDPMNGKHSLMLGLHYLSWLRSQTHNWEQALISYNSGLGTLKNFLESGKDLPQETINYIKKFEKLGVNFS